MTLLGRIAIEAAQSALDKANSQRYKKEIARARKDVNFFCEWVFTDEQKGGAPIVQAPHHKIWQDVVANHTKAVVWFPIEHGKTTQVKFTFCWLLGHHPDRQYAYISSKSKQAEKMVGAVKREIESNERLRLVFPDLKPQRGRLTTALEEWGKTSIRVHGCPPGAKDSSLTAYGLDGQILGSRFHGAIFDNCLDSSNTNTQDLCEKVIDRFRDEIFSRVMSGGFRLFLDTAWLQHDAMHHFASLPGWHSVKLDAEKPLRKGDETLWPAQFPLERLNEIRTEDLGQTAYDRQFRNKPLSETMNYFQQQYWDSAYGRAIWVEPDVGWPDGMPLQIDLRTGVDLAVKPGEEHDLTVFTTLISEGYRRRLFHMESDRIEGGAILRRFVKVFRGLHLPVIRAGGHAKFVVEDNAAQDYIVKLMRDGAILQAIGLTQREAEDIAVVGRTTTSKRRDENFGIQGLVNDFEMGRWDIAANEETRQLREEMKVWSPGAKHYGDRLMSLWIGNSDFTDGSDDWVNQFDIV